jgi:HD-GYP domain-containing protein (c-di-GMP phosphodiesterase class II)
MISKINKILNLVEEKDPKLYEHLESTSMYAFALAKSINLNPKDKELSYFAGLLHDIGKLSVPSKILSKLEEELSEQEVLDLQSHITYGSCMAVFVEGLEELYDIIKHKNEHWDGSGYPDKIKQNTIPIISRVILIASSYHIMREEKKMTHEEAISELRKNSNVKYDPNMVEPFIEIIEEEDLN